MRHPMLVPDSVLKRIVAWMLELGDVRYASLFHRDPKSLPERVQGLPHPDADTMKHRASDPNASHREFDCQLR